MARWKIILIVLIAYGLGVASGMLGLLWATGGLATESQDVQDVVATLAPIDEESNADGAASGDALPAGIFRIDSDTSEARFNILETFFGQENLVIGTSKRVAGDIRIDFANPSASEVGEVAVNVRTVKTDNEFRDQSIRGQILESSQDQFEFVTFQPTSLQNLPTDPIGEGDTVSFQIEGELTVKTTTQTVVFEAEVTVDSESNISGLASTTVLRDDYGLTVNAPPDVTDVAQEVLLEIEFTAVRVEEDA